MNLRNGRVRLIAAVGERGQIGLGGHVPWHGDPDYEKETQQDLSEFYQITEGGVLVVGVMTAKNLPPRFYKEVKSYSRVIRVWENRKTDADAFMGRLLKEFPNRHIWICGGALAYKNFMPYVSWMHISRISYDGPADTYFPSIMQKPGAR